MAQLTQNLVGHSSRVLELVQLAHDKRLPHALVFTGAEGIGKFQAALALAQGLVCEQVEKAPCGTCPACLRLASRQSEALLLFDSESGPLKIEQAREILKFFSLRSLSRSRVVIVDDAHTMTPQAGNALLKALEEPSEDCYFILVTANPSMLLSTVRSRCQMVRLKSLSTAELRKVVAAPDWVLKASRGRVSLAQSLSRPELVELRDKAFQPLNELLAGRVPTALSQFMELATDKEAAQQMCRWWLEILRDALAGPETEDIVHMDQRPLLERLRSLDLSILSRWGGELLGAERDLQSNADRHLVFDHLFLRLGRMSGAVA